MNNKSKHFWQGMNNISKITYMINSRRSNIDKNNILVGEDIILDYTASLERNFMILKSVIVNPNLHKLIASILSDMYKFEFLKSSCIDANIKTTMYSENDLDRVAKISLLEHSFGVFNQMYYADKKTYGRFLDFFLIAALTHDFGKSSKLRSFYGFSDEVNHHKNSAFYLEQKVISFRKLLTVGEMQTYNLVVNAIRIQHDDFTAISSVNSENSEDTVNIFRENELRDIILDFLKLADSAQREKEILKCSIRN